jgi:hypothetical protein
VALSPQATLERGYAIARRTETGELVRRVAQVGGWWEQKGSSFGTNCGRDLFL